MASDVFDEDEHNPAVFFEHDPDEDDLNVGYWTRKDGSRVYGPGDMQTVKALHAQGKAKLDEAGSALAGGDHASAPSPPATRGDAASAASNLAGAGPESLDQQFLNSTTGAEQDEKNEAIGGSQPAPPQPSPAAPVPAQPQAQPLPAPQLPGAARGPARYTDSAKNSESQSLTSGAQSSVARTGSAQDKGEFEQQQGAIEQGYQRQEQAQEQGAQSVVDAQQERKRALMQMAVDRETATAAAQASNEARKQAVIKKYQEVDSRKTDMNGLWKDKGALGTSLGLLGVALRSLNSTKFGGPNTALQSIQEQKRQNLQAQMEDRNSELRGLERELGSIEAAAPMLEARMNDALIKRIDAMTLDEKSATVLANAKTMKAQLETESAAKKAESAKAYYGTLATQQAVNSQQTNQQQTDVERQRLSGAGVADKGGPKRMTPKELAETDQAWEEQGVPPEQRALLWRQNGYSPPTGKTAAEYKRESQGSESDKRNEDQGKMASVQEASGNYARALGGVRKDGQWVKGGTPASDEEQEAAREALRVALHGAGYDEKAAKGATPETPGFANNLLYFVPFGHALASDITPEKQFANLNAAESALRPRLNEKDRAGKRAGDPANFGFAPQR